MHPLEIFLYKKVFNTENGVTKQLKMREIKVEEDKEEIAQTCQREMVQTQKPSM